MEYTTSRPQSMGAIINEDERIIWEGKPNREAYIKETKLKGRGIALLWLAVDSLFIFMFIIVEGTSDINSVPMILFFALHLTPVWLWIANAATAKRQWENAYYIISDKKIMIQEGVNEVECKTIRISDIASLSYTTTSIDKELGTGDITIRLKNPEYSYSKNNRRKTEVTYAVRDIDKTQYVLDALSKLIVD